MAVELIAWHLRAFFICFNIEIDEQLTEVRGFYTQIRSTRIICHCFIFGRDFNTAFSSISHQDSFKLITYQQMCNFRQLLNSLKHSFLPILILKASSVRIICSIFCVFFCILLRAFTFYVLIDTWANCLFNTHHLKLYLKQGF